MLNKHTRFFISFILLILTPWFCDAQQYSGVHEFTAESRLSTGYWVKIGISEDGIYQITDDEMRKMGFTDPECVGVFGFGGKLLDEAFSNPHIDDLPEIAVYRDDPKGRILFYGQGVMRWDYKNTSAEYTHTVHPYSNSGYYFLYQKEKPSLRLNTLPDHPEKGRSVYSFDDYFLHEQDLETVGHTGREMYGESFLYNRVQDFSFEIPGILSAPGTVSVNFIAKSQNASTLQGSINGTSFLNASIDAIGSDKYQNARSTLQKITREFTEEEQQKIRLTFTPGSGGATVARLNYIRINCTRELRPYGAATFFRKREASQELLRYEIEGFKEACLIWDLSDPQTPVIQAVSERGGSFGFTPGETGTKEYALIDLSETFPGPASSEQVSNQNLHALPQCDMVIISPVTFLKEAERLATYRRTHDGLTVAVVTPEAVYNEFSSGTPDATAYRLFMKMFYDRSLEQGMPPRYLLLFGDGAYDNRGLNKSVWPQEIVRNMLLTYESESTLNEKDTYVCDDYFGFLDDNEGGKRDIFGQLSLASDKLDLGVGRLPVRTLKEAEDVVNKIIAYSENRVTGSWKNRLCFLADDGDNNIHMKQADSLVNTLQKAGMQQFIPQKIYLDAYKRESSASGTSYPDVRKKFLEQLDNGALLVSYTGHGATTSITHEDIFTREDASSLQMDRLPVWITGSCDFSRFDHPETSAGEALILNPNGGAIAMFTTTRVVYSTGNLRMSLQLIGNLFRKQEDGSRFRIGDIIKQAKVALGNDINKLNFTLLGDPSLILSYPEYEMELTAINGIETGTEIMELPALSRVRMKGRICRPGTRETDTDFNGTLYPTVFDCEEQVTTLDNDHTGNPMVFMNRTNKLFSGNDSVRNGEFEFSFVVPRDISYSEATSLVNLYARDEAGNEGNGYSDRLQFIGSAELPEEDTEGPLITSLYLNSETFQDGDRVNTTPYLVAYLEDVSGINTTGNSIGHDLALTLTPASGMVIRYVLNEYYESLPGDISRGMVRFSIPALTKGPYELELKAWDTYNNSGTAQLGFIVEEQIKPNLSELQASSNPTREPIRFLLTHDRPESVLQVHIQVYSQLGQCVWEKSVRGSSSFMETLEIPWDLTNLSGQRILPGVYIYRATITENGSSRATRSRKLIVLGR